DAFPEQPTCCTDLRSEIQVVREGLAWGVPDVLNDVPTIAHGCFSRLPHIEATSERREAATDACHRLRGAPTLLAGLSDLPVGSGQEVALCGNADVRGHEVWDREVQVIVR